MFDSQSAAQFARENPAEGFAEVVWGTLPLSDPPFDYE